MRHRSKKKQGKLKKLVMVFFRVGVSFGILYALFYFIPFKDFLKAIKSIPVNTWGLIVGCFALGHIVSALKWRLVVSASGVKIPCGTAVRAHAAGLFANLCLPSIIGGDVIRAGMAVKKIGKLEAITVGSLMDRINDTIALILITSIASVFITKDIPSEIKLAFIAISAFICVAVILAVICIKFVPTTKFPKFLHGIIAKIKLSLNSLLSRPFIALFAFCLSLTIQSSFIFLNIKLAQAIGINIENALWFWAWPLAKLIALAPISLGGLGVREAVLAGLLTPFSVATTLTVSQGLSWQSVLIATGLISGFLVLITMQRQKQID